MTLIVVGNTPAGAYGEQVEKTFSISENKILRFPTQMYENLPQFYQAADLAVFAKQCSLTFYDAQACGVPVVFEDNNINIERGSHGNGLTFASGMVEDFRRCVQQCIDMTTEEWQAMRENSYKFIKNSYDYEQKTQEYIEILEKAIIERKGKR